MVAGKLFLSTLVASSAYAQTIPYSSNGNPQVVYDSGGQASSGIGSFIKYFTGKLPDDDRRLHTQTVMMVLNNAQNGEIGEWYSQTGSNYGKVRVVYTYMASMGYCRVFQSLVVKDGDERQYQETACQEPQSRGWVFYNK